MKRAATTLLLASLELTGCAAGADKPIAHDEANEACITHFNTIPNLVNDVVWSSDPSYSNSGDDSVEVTGSLYANTRTAGLERV